MTVCTYAACTRPAGTVIDGWAMCNRHARAQHTETAKAADTARPPQSADDDRGGAVS